MAEKDSNPDEKLIREAKDRFKLCQDWEKDARKNYIDDYKFAHGDSENGFQWPLHLMQQRQLDERPALTINKTRQHNLQILNDARQNKTAIRITPAGDEATYEASQVFEDVVRHIEYQSAAQDAYDCALETTVEGGWGYWVLRTDYVSPDSFDQEIYIDRIPDPLMVYLDPDIKTKEGSDARYGFIFEDLPRDLFEKKYPQYKDLVTSNPLGVSEEVWADDEHVKVTAYYARTEKRDRLYDVNGKMVLKSTVGAELASQLDKEEDVKSRDIIDHEVMRYFIVGDRIVEKTKWAGRYIPIIRVIGEETVINGVLDRKGHTRALKDPQRMYNYWASAATEFSALQTKSPFTVALESVSGLEVYWENANKENFAYLPYRALDEQGKPLPPPSREAPPQISQAYLAGMQASANEMQMVSGQYDAQMGKPSNERTGVAIEARQRKADNATYHFVDNLAVAIRYTGKQLIDLIPKIYDTERVIQAVAESGEKRQIEIAPQNPKALLEEQIEENAVRQVFNPNVGRYEVEADVGPEFATKRQEAFSALIQLAGAAPMVMEATGDLVMKAADFPMADDLAERLHNMLPPQALGGPNPEMVQMQQQMAQMHSVIEDLMEKITNEQVKARTESQQKVIDVYKAETDRMGTLAKIDPTPFLPVLKQLVDEAIQTHIGNVTAASKTTLDKATLPEALSGQM